MNRYAFCSRQVRGKRILELGTGGGFGAHHLAAHARNVISIDIDLEAIRTAAQTYSRPNLAYLNADVTALPFADETFDSVIAYEIIEHLHNPEDMLRETRRVLRNQGLLYVSTPNIERHYEKITVRNPYHLTDFTLLTFTHLLRKYFPTALVYGQCPTWDIGLREKTASGKFVRKLQILLRYPRSAVAVFAGKAAVQLRASRELPAWNSLNLISRHLLPEAKVFLAVCQKD